MSKKENEVEIIAENQAETETNIAKEKVEEYAEPKELNLDIKVTLHNLAPWGVSFSRKADGNFGDIVIPPKSSTTRLSRAEIIIQVQVGNKLIAGIDGFGNHATLYIDDAPTRIELGFESPDGKTKQKFLSEKSVKDAFDLKTDKAFESRIEDMICTRAERLSVMKIIHDLKINDHARIEFVKEHINKNPDLI